MSSDFKRLLWYNIPQISQSAGSIIYPFINTSMVKSNDNLCPRCGKPRITAKTWTEMIGNSKVTFSDTVCPDKECQKKLEADNLAKKEKRESLQKKRNNLTLSRRKH